MTLSRLGLWVSFNRFATEWDTVELGVIDLLASLLITVIGRDSSDCWEIDDGV